MALDETDVVPGTASPWFEAATKRQDPRHQWFVERFGRRCWELDALSPVTLRHRVEDRIVALLDADAWNHAIEVERAEVESMRNVMSAWKSSISGPASKYSPPDGSAA